MTTASPAVGVADNNIEITTDYGQQENQNGTHQQCKIYRVTDEPGAKSIHCTLIYVGPQCRAIFPVSSAYSSTLATVEDLVGVHPPSSDCLHDQTLDLQRDNNS